LCQVHPSSINLFVLNRHIFPNIKSCSYTHSHITTMLIPCAHMSRLS
jgi:hypothetical protein